MLKSATYSQKYRLIPSWVPHIVRSVKKDLKSEHLRKDPSFFKEHFPGKNINKLSPDDLVSIYQTILTLDQFEELGEFVANRWLLKHTDLYYFFEEKLSTLSPHFSDLEEIEEGIAERLMHESIEQFGPQNTYIFCILNSVVFPQKVYHKLEKLASSHQEAQEQKIAREAEEKSREALILSHEREIARLTDRYEKKLLGLQKKYDQDTEALKKQLASLQRRLQNG